MEIDAVALREQFAKDGDRETGTVGRDAHVYGERVERPHPQVVGLLPEDLVEQARIDASSKHRGGPERELASLMLSLRVRGALG